MSDIRFHRVENDDVPDEPHTFAIRRVKQGEQSGEYLFFACPRSKGRCGVPLKPLSNPPHNSGWTFDGNHDAPTLSPSINCVGGCGWHGFVQCGVFTSCPDEQ